MNANVLSLDTFERLVYSRRYDQAVVMLIEIIESIELKTFDLIPDAANGDENRDLKINLLTRFVAGITTMFSDPEFDLKEPLFLKLLLYKRYLVSLFATTSFSNMDHIVWQAGQAVGNDQVTWQGESSYFKLLLASSIYSSPELVLQTLNAATKNFKILYWISLLDTETVLDSRADQLRNQLLLEGESLQNELVPDEFVVRLINIWMFVSYFTTPKKHDVKRWINSMLLKWMKKSGVTQPVLSPKKTGKLKLLILSEHFTSNHAMYRCFSPSLAQLRSKFYTTLVATTGSYDDTSKSLFDELIDFDRTDPIKKIIGKIIKAQADIIYYPSLGMHSWTIMASQLRLAPIQMMTLGHPATSNSVFMDYTLIEEFSLGDPQCFSETVVVKNEGAKYCPYDDKEPPAPVIRENPDIIKIAIPATMYKLNSNFLHVCNNIRNRVKRRVEFHFFPNRIGIMLDFARQMIWKSLPDSTIYPSMSYEDYMTNLGSCDIHFSTFPFGLVNGVVDSALLGLPIVALDGPEVHSHADVGFQKRLGLPEWLSAQNEEEFEEAAIRIISDDALRVQISNAIIAADPYKLFFSNDQTKTDYFANLADWIYRNHEALQADGRKIWNEEDFIDGGDVQPVLANSTS